MLDILEIELDHLQDRVLQTGKGQFVFRVTCPAKLFLVQEGLDKQYGARHLKRALERHLVHPLASLLATEQIKTGDRLCIDWDEANEGCEKNPEETKHGEQLYQNAGGDDGRYVIDSKAGRSFGEVQPGK